MKTTTEEYAGRMRRRQAPSKKGKKRKDIPAINRESNAALMRKIGEMERHANWREYLLLATIEILRVALGKACAKTYYTRDEYIKMARAEVNEKSTIPDAIAEDLKSLQQDIDNLLGVSAKGQTATNS